MDVFIRKNPSLARSTNSPSPGKIDSFILQNFFIPLDSACKLSMEKDWKRVRHVPSGKSWHTANDNLM